MSEAPTSAERAISEDSKKPSLFREYRVEILIFVIGLLLINAIFLPKAFRQSTAVDPEGASQLGNFVGGYIGPILSLLGVLVLVATFRSQRELSEKQSFENKYFELLKMHRDNVGEIEIRNASGDRSASGRKLFVLMLREFRAALKIISELAQSSQITLTQEELIHLAYYCVFYGVGPNSSRMLKLSLASFPRSFVNSIESRLNNHHIKNIVARERNLFYVPFEGHQSRLGHYYRHLYQMVRYVDERTPESHRKYEYMKTVRAQLSTHEQALLLINSLTPVGRNWWRKHLIDRYRLVQNIPRGFFDKEKELDIDQLFPSSYFEWSETPVAATPE
jgi:hypothetical protein